MGYYVILAKSEEDISPASIFEYANTIVDVVQVDKVTQSFFESAQKCSLVDGCVKGTIERFKSEQALTQVFD